MSQRSIFIGRENLSIADIVAMSKPFDVRISLDATPSYMARIARGPACVDAFIAKGQEVYGVNTGYGDSCTTSVPVALIDELPYQLFRGHMCGMGSYLSPELTRSVLGCRIASLAKGFSGIRYELLSHLVNCLSQDLLPLIPEEGSVGASGDLVPLAYIAAMIAGEGQVRFKGEILPTKVAYETLKMNPLKLRSKDALALMNGTAIMTAMACHAFSRSEYLLALSTRLSAMAVLALEGNPDHFDEKLFAVKPHPGQIHVAGNIRKDLEGSIFSEVSHRLQDRYSIRCAPHVLGVLKDSLEFIKIWIEREINSCNDNPIIDPDEQHVLHGGHFYGGYIAFAMDSLKNSVANIADLMDRQMALLVDPKFNHGLPSNLVGVMGPRAAINHGFKAVQIATSSWTAEALKLTMPASVFSRSTECHNQDKVSMGTHSARDCLRVIELTEQVAAALMLATTQALEQRNPKLAQVSKRVKDFCNQVRSYSKTLTEDRPLDGDLRTMVSQIQERGWSLDV